MTRKCLPTYIDFYLCICRSLFVAQIKVPRGGFICATNIHVTDTKSIEHWFHNATDSAANVSSIFAITSVGHSLTVIQALARLLAIACFLYARFPGIPEAVPGGWLGNEFIEFVLAFSILILVGFKRKDLSQRKDPSCTELGQERRCQL